MQAAAQSSVLTDIDYLIVPWTLGLQVSINNSDRTQHVTHPLHHLIRLHSCHEAYVRQQLGRCLQYVWTAHNPQTPASHVLACTGYILDQICGMILYSDDSKLSPGVLLDPNVKQPRPWTNIVMVHALALYIGGMPAMQMSILLEQPTSTLMRKMGSLQLPTGPERDMFRAKAYLRHHHILCTKEELAMLRVFRTRPRLTQTNRYFDSPRYALAYIREYIVDMLVHSLPRSVTSSRSREILFSALALIGTSVPPPPMASPFASPSPSPIPAHVLKRQREEVPLDQVPRSPVATAVQAMMGMMESPPSKPVASSSTVSLTIKIDDDAPAS